jgi:hypothetical protein
VQIKISGKSKINQTIRHSWKPKKEKRILRVISTAVRVQVPPPAPYINKQAYGPSGEGSGAFPEQILN